MNSIPEHVEVVPAYGRKYRATRIPHQALEDWRNDLDFKCTTGPYINKSDAYKYDIGVVLRLGEKLYTLRQRGTRMVGDLVVGDIITLGMHQGPREVKSLVPVKSGSMEGFVIYFTDGSAYGAVILNKSVPYHGHNDA